MWRDFTKMMYSGLHKCTVEHTWTTHTRDNVHSKANVITGHTQQHHTWYTSWNGEVVLYEAEGEGTGVNQHCSFTHFLDHRNSCKWNLPTGQMEQAEAPKAVWESSPTGKL